MLSRLFRMANLEDPTVDLTGRNIAEALSGRRKTSSGEMVGVGEAVSYSPVWSALDQISSDIARLPWLPYRDTDDGRELAKRHPLYQIMTRSVDGGMTTSNIWMVRTLCHALLYGNSYSKIHWAPVGAKRYVAKLEWIHSDKVTVYRENGEHYYVVAWNPMEDGRTKTSWERVDYDSMFHLQGLTIGSLGGLSLIQYARDTIGRQLAANKYGDEFFANSAIPQGFFAHPGNLSEPAQNRFIQQMEKRFSGSGNRHRIGFLEEDMKWVPTGISPKDALLIDAMKWGIPDVARFFSIPPHKLGDPSRQGWNTTEQENQSYYNSTLGKWTSRICCESHKLFDREEQADHYTAFDTDELLRADTAARYSSYGIGIQWGFLTRNDVRQRENLPPLDGLDDPLTPVNMATGGGALASEAPPEDEPVEEDDADDMDGDAGTDSVADDDEDARPTRARLHHAQRDVVTDQLVRMTKRVIRAASRAAREPRKFLGHLNDMDTEHGAAVREALTPAAGLVAAIRREHADQTLDRMASELIERGRDELLRAAEVRPEELVAAVEAVEGRMIAWCREASARWIE